MLHGKFRHFATGRATAPPTELSSSGIKPVIHTGIYCDCLGTLYSETKGPNHLLVAYLNEKYRRGHEITLVSSTPVQSLPLIRGIGLAPQIVQSLIAKKHILDCEVEILIDDNPPEGQRAKLLWDPNAPSFKIQMRRYLQENGIEAPRPT